MYELETSGIVVQTGIHGSDTYVQVTSCGEETTNCVCALIFLLIGSDDLEVLFLSR